jgi:hypothetical protein
VSDEIVPDKNLGAAPQPLRGAERNSPAPPRGAFHLRVDLGGRPQHTPGVPLVPTFQVKAQAPRDRPGSLLSGEGLRGYCPLVHFRLKQAASPPLLLPRGKKDSALPRRLRLRRFANPQLAIVACRLRKCCYIRHPELDLGRSAFLAGYAHAPFERRLLTSACHVGVLGLVNAPALAGSVD